LNIIDSLLFNVCSVNSTLSNRSVAMQPNKTKISLIIGAMYLGVSGASMAASESFNITAETIADVVITEDTALDFGANIFTTAGDCTMDASAPADVTMQVTRATPVVVDTDTHGALSGTSCVTGAIATPGVYTVSGSGGSTVNITLGGITTAEFTFVPDSNAVSTYEGTAALDDIGTLSTSTSTAVVLADTNDGGGATTTADELVFVLGGTLTILTDLTSETVYDAETFTVNVIY
jgi:hypothetical protein